MKQNVWREQLEGGAAYVDDGASTRFPPLAQFVRSTSSKFMKMRSAGTFKAELTAAVSAAAVCHNKHMLSVSSCSSTGSQMRLTTHLWVVLGVHATNAAQADHRAWLQHRTYA